MGNCNDCQYHDVDGELPENSGTCELHLKHRDPKMWTDCGENTIRTTSDFGCNQFLEKSLEVVGNG